MGFMEVSRRRSLVGLLLALAGAQEVPSHDAQEMEAENEELRNRLRVLEEKLHDDAQYAYVVQKGYLSGAETIYMETMEVAEAKQWCNANANCKGFTFLAPAEGEVEPDDEVTVTFKGAPEAGERLKVDADASMMSYVKESTTAFGAVGDAAMNLAGADGHAVVTAGLTYNGISLLFVVALAATAACGSRLRGGSSRGGKPMLPT